MLNLLEHPHLFDGGLARAMAYLALALILGQLYWRQRLQQGPAWGWLVWFLGTTGMLLALNSIWLSVSTANGGQASDSSMLDMLSTQFTRAWLMYWLGLCLSLWLLRRIPWLSLLSAIAMLLAMGLSAHAGEAGALHLIFWLDVLHMGLALLWLGSLSLMLLSRLSSPDAETTHPLSASTAAHPPARAPIGLDDLKRFSMLALPLFITILLSGLARLGLGWEENAGFAFTYAMMLLFKLCAVLGVMLCAWHLRKLLRHRPFSGKQFDNGLSAEYFLALLLLLFTSLLTQLSPG